MPTELKPPTLSSDLWRRLAEACNYFSDMGLLNGPTADALPLSALPIKSHPYEWSRVDVTAFLDWCRKEFDLEEVPKDKFKLNGKALCILTKTDICQRAPETGDVIYNMLQRLMGTENKEADVVEAASSLTNKRVPTPEVQARQHPPMPAPDANTPEDQITYCHVLGRQVVVPPHVNLPGIEGPVSIKIRRAGKRKRLQRETPPAKTEQGGGCACPHTEASGNLPDSCCRKDVQSRQTVYPVPMNCPEDCDGTCGQKPRFQKDSISSTTSAPVEAFKAEPVPYYSQPLTPTTANGNIQVYQALTPDGFPTVVNLPSIDELTKMMNACQEDEKHAQAINTQLKHLMSYQQKRSYGGGELYKSVSVPATSKSDYPFTSSGDDDVLMKPTSVIVSRNVSKTPTQSYHPIRDTSTVASLVSPDKLKGSVHQEFVLPPTPPSTQRNAGQDSPVSPLLVKGSSAGRSVSVSVPDSPFNPDSQNEAMMQRQNLAGDGANESHPTREPKLKRYYEGITKQGAQSSVGIPPDQPEQVFDMLTDENSQTSDGLCIDEHTESDCLSEKTTSPDTPHDNIPYSMQPLLTPNLMMTQALGRGVPVYAEGYKEEDLKITGIYMRQESTSSMADAVVEQKKRQEVAETMTLMSSQKSPMHDQGPPEEGKLLWEFLSTLLEEPHLYRDVIAWEDQKQRVFRIRCTERLAALWGAQKQKRDMTYEKLSRSLRYYYGVKIISKVPGRRLTYRFEKPPTDIVKGQRGAKPGVPHRPRGSRLLLKEQKKLERQRRAEEAEQKKMEAAKAQLSGDAATPSNVTSSLRQRIFKRAAEKPEQQASASGGNAPCDQLISPQSADNQGNKVVKDSENSQLDISATDKETVTQTDITQQEDRVIHADENQKEQNKGAGGADQGHIAEKANMEPLMDDSLPHPVSSMLPDSSTSPGRRGRPEAIDANNDMTDLDGLRSAVTSEAST